MVDIKPQSSPNIVGAPSERYRLLEAQSRPDDLTMNGPTATRMQCAVESVDTRVSVKARILNAVGGLTSSIATILGTDVKMISTGPRAVSIGNVHPALTTALSPNKVTGQQTAPHIIVFRLAESAKPDTVLQQTVGPVSLAIVHLNPLGQIQQAGQTLGISPKNNTITGFVQSLNGLSGLKAYLLQTREGLAILVTTCLGPLYALEPASIGTLWRLLQTAPPSGPQPLVVTAGRVAAKDTLGERHGQPVAHAATTIETLVSAYHATAGASGQMRLQSGKTIASLQRRVEALLREMNKLITLLANTAQSSTGTSAAPSLSDRTLAHVLLGRLRKIMTRPIYGFVPDPVLPADLGIEVDTVGLLTLNKDRFTLVAKHRRDILAAIIGPTTGQDGAERAQGGPHILANGVHKLVYDPTLSPVTATLNETPLATDWNALGRPVLSLRTQTQELSIVLKTEVPVTADINYGQSLFDQITDFANEVVNPDDPLIGTNSRADRLAQVVEPEEVAPTMVAAIFVRQITQVDVAQSNAVDILPPEVAQMLVYLLWTGLYKPDGKRGRNTKHRTHTPYGWRCRRRYRR